MLWNTRRDKKGHWVYTHAAESALYRETFEMLFYLMTTLFTEVCAFN